MMNRTRRTNCLYCNVRLTARNFDPRESPDSCTTCFEQAGWENDHVDGNHEDGDRMDVCPSCNPDLVVIHPDKPKTKRTGHKNTTPKSHSSHDACYAAGLHACTPAGRAACRKTR